MGHRRHGRKVLKRMSSLDLMALEGKAENAASSLSPRGTTFLKDVRATMSMSRSWSMDSLSNMAGAAKTCVCAPTKHAGSFRCRLHRMHSSTVARAQKTQGASHLPPQPTTPSACSNFK
ncbi:hypothetical protein KI387_038771 [Taxus chinensis]|uniref:Uncharacterized protein n=1 Tax=Taxus chinensis TaxID=29808 RepID=A0AA38C9Y4_TAXCH|nr:hypothetical protein KI387_038771 [Taxus chinensis]